MFPDDVTCDETRLAPAPITRLIQATDPQAISRIVDDQYLARCHRIGREDDALLVWVVQTASWSSLVDANSDKLPRTQGSGGNREYEQLPAEPRSPFV